MSNARLIVVAAGLIYAWAVGVDLMFYRLNGAALWFAPPLVWLGVWRNRQAARRTLRLLYRVATRCPACGHPAASLRYDYCRVGFGSIWRNFCGCAHHGKDVILPQPPAPECWQ